jgi:hypothetical protein
VLIPRPTLTIVTAASTPVGSYTLTVTATSGILSHSGAVFLGVRSNNGDFTGTITPNSLTVAVGQTTTFTANITYLNGFTPTPDGCLTLCLSISGVPAAFSGIQFASTSAQTSTGETDTFTVSVPPGTPAGSLTLLLTGSGGGRIRSAPFSLTITP